MTRVGPRPTLGCDATSSINAGCVWQRPPHAKTRCAPVAPSADTDKAPRRSTQPHLFRGLLTCGLLGRRMIASVHHGHIYYRCVARTLG